MAPKLFCCVLFIACCSTVVVGQIPMDCCLETRDVKIPTRLVKDYHRQISGQGCSVEAVIFVTRNNKYLCATADRDWVNNLIKEVNKLKEQCKKRNYKSNRCKGLTPS